MRDTENVETCSLSTVVASNSLAVGQDGLLGSSTLRQLSPIVVDYVDGELLLGH
jgi:hypothetical protein